MPPSFVAYFVLGLIAVVLAVVAPIAHDKWKRTASIPVGLIGLLLLLVGAQAFIQSGPPVTARSEEPATSAPAKSTDATTTPTPTPTVSAATISPSGSPEASSPGLQSSTVSPSATPSASRYFLAKLAPVASEKEGRPGSCTGGCTGFTSGPGRIAGMVYPVSFLMGNDGDGRRSTATWNLARSCSRLEMTVGVDDSTSSQP